MMMKPDNAIIMAAGTSSRFAPLSYEKHKALTTVKGEILIERQIRQLKAASVNDIYIITGYKAEQFEYLKENYKVKLIYNSEYAERNNHNSIYVARDVLCNSYVCSADNYFAVNPFEFDDDVYESYYAAEYAVGHTSEWCITEDDKGYIDSVTVGGENSWYMMGHTFWSEDFSVHFLRILEGEYKLSATKGKLWENIYMEHLDVLKMRIRKYPPRVIYEFDTLDELRQFDSAYINDSGSLYIKRAAESLGVNEKEIKDISPIRNNHLFAEGFEFVCSERKYRFLYNENELKEVLREERRHNG